MKLTKHIILSRITIPSIIQIRNHEVTGTAFLFYVNILFFSSDDHFKITATEFDQKVLFEFIKTLNPNPLIPLSLNFLHT
jgi:hypothetical protein